MQATSIAPTLMESFVHSIIGAFGAVPGAALMVTPKVHLFSALSGLISPTMAITAFTECSFPGYTSGGISPTVTGNFPNNRGLGMFAGASFAANTSITPPGENALGYWVDNGTTTLYAAELFPSPIPFVNPYDFLNLTVLLGLTYVSQEQ